MGQWDEDLEAVGVSKRGTGTESGEGARDSMCFQHAGTLAKVLKHWRDVLTLAPGLQKLIQTTKLFENCKNPHKD